MAKLSLEPTDLDATMGPKLQRRKALVLGAAGGMGRATALELSRRGVTVGLAGRDDAGGKAIPVTIDVARVNDLGDAVAHAIDLLGGLNFLVNCAGRYHSAKAQEANLREWDDMLDTNFRGFVHIARHALPEINKSGTGAVVAIGSITSAYAGAGMHIAARRALTGFCEALFEDVREFGTKVCVIQPGYVNTPMVRSDRLDRGKMIQPEDIARTVVFVLEMPATASATEIVLRPQRTPYREA
jgi:NADP-dependent 3-hydroxy acid dehydrogenase YdfG